MGSVLYLYALAGRYPEGHLGCGLTGEPLRSVACGPTLFALVGDIAERPRPSRETLAVHDATVRRLAGLLPALLPARFGETARDEEALRSLLAPRAAELAPALALVEGSVQMTLRVFSDGTSAPPGDNAETAGTTQTVEIAGIADGGSIGPLEAPVPSESSVVPDGLGPGARYLAERRQLQARRSSLPEVAALREALRPLLRAERVERHGVSDAGGAGRLVATAYDLVGREQLEAYRSTLERESARLSGYRVAASGPWPPYAFAPEVA